MSTRGNGRAGPNSDHNACSREHASEQYRARHRCATPKRLAVRECLSEENSEGEGAASRMKREMKVPVAFSAAPHTAQGCHGDANGAHTRHSCPLHRVNVAPNAFIPLSTSLFCSDPT